MQTYLFPLVKSESIARESCRLRMGKVGLGSSLVSKGIGVSSSLRVSCTSSMVVIGVGVPWESCFVRASLLPPRAARRLVIESTNLIARGARESSLRRQVNKRQDIFS